MSNFSDNRKSEEKMANALPASQIAKTGSVPDKNKYQIIFDLSPEAIVITRLQDSKLIEVNQGFSNVTGYSAEDAIGKSLSELNLWVNYAERTPYLKQLKEKGLITNYQFLFRTKKGDIRNGLLSAKMITLNGESHILAINRDIQDLVDREVALKHETQKRWETQIFLDAVLNTIPEPIFIKNEDHQWILLNQAYCDFMGYKREELMGKSDYDFFPEDEARVFWDKDDEVFRTEMENTNEESFTDSQGITHIISTKKAIFKNEYGQKILCGIIRDISALKHLQEEQLKASRLESIGILAGGIAHDFNNILTAIVGGLTMIRLKSEDKPEIIRLLNYIDQASQKAVELTRQLLTFSKGDSPMKEIRSLEILADESTRFSLRGSNVEYKLICAPDLFRVEVDADQISRVIQNIVMNADQAMPDGGLITIAMENVYVCKVNNYNLPPGDYVKLSITDEGSGVDPNDIPKIFDPYFTTRKTGSGLGLPIAYSIIKKHYGYLGIDSKLKKGTTIYFLLPATMKTSIEQVDDHKKHAQIFQGSGRILIMDDDESVLTMAQEMLTELGFTAEFARHGNEAIDKYKLALDAKDPFDLAIFDLTIPGGMGGKETMEQIKIIDPHARVIVSSGYSNNPVMSRYREFGFSGILKKPYTIHEISTTIFNVQNS